jgi:D-beta-D-heptose 7-phosphate kinase/D-beta-D-heptose 1-phosphate adenosyltransferase|tara:strand:+ start:676 stop:1077 length:402 start_codon:yes stop_codon:yes gene_type:complete
MKTVFVNGTFDVLHMGHLALLNHAKSLGDALVVAIDCDERVKMLKGSTRPINSELERKAMLMNLKAVDVVVIFKDHDNLVKLVQDSQASIIVKGSDHKGKGNVEGQQYVEEVVWFDRIEGFSTTEKIESIIAG